MPIPDEVILLLERDIETLTILREAAEVLGCDRIEAESFEGLNELLSLRQPRILVIAIECIEAQTQTLLHTLSQGGRCAYALLVGSAHARVLSSARRTVESYGLTVIGVIARPIDTSGIERLLAPFLQKPPPISCDELESALAEHELVLQYQPKITIDDEEPRVLGVEALVRWQHPRRGMLAPLKFLGAVEEHGLMSRLTDYVMSEAVRQVGVWRERNLLLEMVVNLNPKLVRDLGFPERLAVLLHEHGVPASQLMLDVTESPSTSDHALMLSVFTRLRILGIGLSLDNFGTGLSSLTELYRLPFSEIKIDHSIIADLSCEPDAKLIVKAIVDLAHTLQLTVCAEGIEARESLEFVRSIGCDTAQGRFFSGPVNASEIERLVLAWPKSATAATGNWRAMMPADFNELTTTRRRGPGRFISRGT